MKKKIIKKKHNNRVFDDIHHNIETNFSYVIFISVLLVTIIITLSNLIIF